MAGIDHDRLTDLFCRASKLAASQRGEYLDSACAGDAALRAELDDLLGCVEPASRAFDAAAQQVVAPDPEQIGRYKILELIGEGGMAVVYKAQQEHPVKRLVAIKLIKLGMDTRQFVARFEAERQALAMMDHPNVAKVLDGGATEAGRPYFVMEYAAGEPITAYCDRQRLTIRQRLELFIQVCDGVQHAHQKAIIHRDLKPSNILVTSVDGPSTPLGTGKPHARVIDFGVAKAMSQRLTELTMVTQSGQFIGTPAYMSPEQADGQVDIDTRSDVYSLGVVLYELLTGERPFDSDTLGSASMNEVQRIIREVEPPRPSTRLSQLTSDTTFAIASSRQMALPTLIHEMRRELEWIPLKAMRKERGQRYRSAADLADDIRNYLSGRPLIAGPESRSYKLRKFIRRNRTGVLAASTVTLALAAATIVSLLFAAQARRESARATREATLAVQARQEAERRQQETQQVGDFQSNMLREIDVEAMGRGIKEGFRQQVRSGIARQYVGEHANQRKRTEQEIDAELAAYDERAHHAQPTDVARRVMDEYVLKRAGQALEKEFADKPLVQADLMRAIGSTYQVLGLYGKAEPYLRGALKLRREVLGPANQALAQDLTYLARLMRESGEYAAAESLYRDSLAMYRKLLGDEHPHVATAMGALGKVLSDKGDHAAAEPLLRGALALHRKLKDDNSLDVATCLNYLALLLAEEGDFAAAEPLFRDSLAVHSKELGEENWQTVAVRSNLAHLLGRKGDYAAAERLYRESLATRRKLYGDEHPSVATNLNDLGWLLDAAGDDTGAEIMLREALALNRKLRGDDHQELATSLNNLASLLQDKGDYAAAEPLFRESLAVYRRMLGAENLYVTTSLTNLASLLQAKGDYAAAEQHFRQALAMRRKLLGDEHWKTLNTANGLGSLLRTMGRPKETIDLLAPLEQAQRRAFAGGDTRRLGRFLTQLGRARAEVGQLKLAECNLNEAYEIVIAAKGTTRQDQTDVLTGFLELHQAWHAVDPHGRHDLQAADWRAKLDSVVPATQPASQPAPPSHRT